MFGAGSRTSPGNGQERRTEESTSGVAGFPSLFKSWIVAGGCTYADEPRLLDQEWMKRASPIEAEAPLGRGAALDARDKDGPTPWGCGKFHVWAASVGFGRSGGMAGTVATRAGPPRACRPGPSPERGHGAISTGAGPGSPERWWAGSGTHSPAHPGAAP